ncbi:hypothetical protein GCM10010319_31470 [Streptomyces blastmyceticus]|uniref:Uncharacterized protein n=1 Tax=Streptomyces blastmyceticus TaxID=68180 RepID=A0ABN0X1I6_9ACTN
MSAGFVAACGGGALRARPQTPDGLFWLASVLVMIHMVIHRIVLDLGISRQSEVPEAPPGGVNVDKSL